MVNRTVGEHIRTLEAQLKLLNSRIMEESNVSKRNDLETEIRAVQSALTLYRSALEVESRVFVPHRDL